jgi:hypothetical protein
MRKYNRVAYNEKLNYSLSVPKYEVLQKVDSNGTGIDISDEGLGFYTAFPLEPGHVLRIRKESSTAQTVIVRWVDKTDGNFRVGVFFV